MRAVHLLLAVIPCLRATAAFITSGGSWSSRRTSNGRVGIVLPGVASSSSPGTILHSVLEPGDTILVIGGTGGVGQLVTKKLQSRGLFSVRVSSRNKKRGEETIADSSVDVVELDLVGGSNADLEAAMEGVSGVVVATGTTAFPTLKWKNGNTPEAIDKLAVSRIAEAAAKGGSAKKVVLLTSIGVDRTKQMPFLVLNLFGVLDAKKSGEDAVKKAASRAGFDYAIIRPGRLIGGPFTNLDVAKLLQIEGGAENGVDIEAGDSLIGDCKRDACAEAVVQCLLNEDCKIVDFAIISNENKALTDPEWTKTFQQMGKR